MCGIAGILMKHGDADSDVGRMLVAMLSALEHRGPDSSGVAVFGPRNSELTLRLAVEKRELLPAVEEVLGKLGLPARRETHPRYDLMIVELGDEGARERLLQAVKGLPEVQIHSAGYSMTIVKDTVTPEELNREFHIEKYRGSHGIGHVRLATESRVACGYAHPFQSLDLPDLCIVHNGTITNYHKMRRALERKGFRFQTENDSELIAQAIAYHLFREGKSFSEALEEVHGGLDGTYSFIVATPEGMGIAKDRLAAKPMMIGESDWGVAIASEEVAIRSVLGDEALVEELPPSEVRTWIAPGRKPVWA